MVERTTPGEGKRLEEFTGKVTDVALEVSTFEDNAEQQQYHITMVPEGVTIKGKTGALHEWIKLSPKATQKSVPEGSVVERYLSQLEVVLPESKSAKTLSEAFGMMKGKRFKFKRLKLGRPFKGQPAKELWVPVQTA